MPLSQLLHLRRPVLQLLPQLLILCGGSVASFIVENTRRLIVALVHGQVFNEVQQLREQHAIETEQLRESEKHRAESEQSKAEAEIHRAESSNPKPKWRNSEGNSEIRRSEPREREREEEEDKQSENS